MSRVHCVDCATSVVVDPQGICPEGHHVGAGGARVEAAMGSRTAHPDEPEPWVYRIDPATTSAPGARTNGHHTAPARELRPVRVPGVLAEDVDDGEPADADALLRELHSLAALEERVPPPPPVEAAAPTTVPRRPPQPPTAPRAPKLDRDAMSDAFAELSGLDAPTPEPAARTSNGHGPSRNGSRPVPGHARNGTASTAAIAADGSAPAPAGDTGDLAALFSSELDAPTTAGPERTGETGHTSNGATSGGNRFDELFAAAVSAPQLRSRDHGSAAGHAEPDTAAAPPTTGPPPVPGAGATPASGPATSAPRRRRTATARTETAPPPRPADEAPAPPSVAAPEPAAVASAPALDLSSFSAKGGSGHRSGRKRRFGR